MSKDILREAMRGTSGHAMEAEAPKTLDFHMSPHLAPSTAHRVIGFHVCLMEFLSCFAHIPFLNKLFFFVSACLSKILSTVILEFVPVHNIF